MSSVINCVACTGTGTVWRKDETGHVNPKRCDKCDGTGKITLIIGDPPTDPLPYIIPTATSEQLDNLRKQIHDLNVGPGTESAAGWNGGKPSWGAIILGICMAISAIGGAVSGYYSTRNNEGIQRVEQRQEENVGRIEGRIENVGKEVKATRAAVEWQPE